MPECRPGEQFSGYAYSFDARIECHSSCFLSLPLGHNLCVVHVIPKINSGYFPIQQSLVSMPHGNGMCSV